MQISIKHRNSSLFLYCQVLVWNVAEQQIVSRLDNTRIAPCSVGWCPHDRDCLAFIYGRGPLYVWSYSAGAAGLTLHKEAQNFISDVTKFR